jgi:hypothetical protein
MQARSVDVDDAVSILRSSHLAISAQNWPRKSEQIDRPGLYSWWVTNTGASQLSESLGTEIEPGLIYAGQAGATSWPSGRRYSQTLLGRIGKNHIAGAIRHSTLRRTLAGCLATTLDLVLLDGAKPTLALGGEHRLTEWIRAQMAVVLFPFNNRDCLSDLEDRVLESLDPPLNLDGMKHSPARASLRLLRGRSKMADNPLLSVPTVLKAPGEARKPRVRSGSLTLHEEIADILNENDNEWMTTLEIARSANRRSKYQKRDGSEISAFQIHGRTRNYGDLFERDGSKVRLIEDVGREFNHNGPKAG